MKFKLILLSFTSILILTSCETGKEAIDTNIPESYKADEKKIVEQRKNEMAASVEEIPEWFLDQDEIGDLLSSRGTSTSSDLQMSIDKAMLAAKRELASKIEQTITGKTKQFLKDVGIDENSDNYDETIVTSISRIDNVELAGFKVSNRKVINLGTKYRTYVKLVFPIGSANKILVEKVNKEEQLKLRLESSEAFKDLEEQIKNAQDD